MSLRAQVLMNVPVIELDTIDSTNNYAMRLIDADKAQSGLTVLAREQSNGKGQRGKSWMAAPGDNILMSIILAPERALDKQFYFLAGVAVAVASVLRELSEDWQVHVKWPNDIIVNDKKAGGILIENIIRGRHWVYSVVGIGLNVLQDRFPESLPHAISLKMAVGTEWQTKALAMQLRERIIQYLSTADDEQIFSDYNKFLYQRDQMQLFGADDQWWQAKVSGVTRDGRLVLIMEDGTTSFFHHGSIQWGW